MTVRFSASNAGRLMACPASGNLNDAILGWVEPVRDDMAGAKGVGSKRHALFAEFNELSTSEMRAMTRSLQYVADLRATRRFKVLVETTMKATWLQQEPETTADLVLFTQDELHVLDLKWGRIPVEVVDNEQLMYYAATYGHLAPKAKGVTVHILQPMAEGNSSWFISTTRLAQFMDEARKAEAKLLAKDVTFGPSDHCTFCPANPHSRGDKGSPLCPPMLQILYPSTVDEAAILDL